MVAGISAHAESALPIVKKEGRLTDIPTIGARQLESNYIDDRGLIE